MAGLVGYGCTGQLYIGDGDLVEVSMNNSGWDITDMTPLWAVFDVRGQDRRVPGVNGVVPYRRRFDVTEHGLDIVILGDADKDGNANADAWIGLQENIDYLRDNVIDPPNVPGSGLKLGRLVMPSGEQRYASIHVLGLTLSQTQGIGNEHAFVLGTLNISIPRGVFATV